MSQNGPDPAVSAALAGFVAESRWEDLPGEVRHAAKRSLLNFFAVAFAGSGDAATAIVRDTLGEFAGRGEATLVGRAERTDALTAAFVNAVAANVHDFDDTHLRTVIHPTAPVAPPLLALAERQRVTGPELLQALALGIEATLRIGNAVSPSHYSRGWHITATCGVFGAALAAGKLLGLDRERLVWALGGASAQAAGLVETLGFMAKSVGVGGASRGGLLAALLAERRLDGPARPLEGPRGFLSVAADAADLAEITDGLGERWEILCNIHKPYPCGVVLFPVIDACLELLARGTVPLDAVSAITLHGHPLLRQRADRPHVQTGREAQVSAQHAVAACLIHGAAGLAQFSDAAVQEPEVLALRGKVRVADAGDVPVAGVRLEVETRDGARETVVVDGARGTDARPLSDAEIEVKLRTLMAQGAPGSRPQELIDAVWGFDEQPDAAALLAFARPSA